MLRIVPAFQYFLVRLLLHQLYNFPVSLLGAIPNIATEKEPKRNFLYFTDVTLVVVDTKSEMKCVQHGLFDMTMVTIMFDTKSSESESSIEGLI